jgi:very-short-patch-repair endonuclease
MINSASTSADIPAGTAGTSHAIGRYIPDFVCIQKKLIIELDGSQHLEQAEYDTERTRFLESQGYTVLRFWNNDVMNDIHSVIKVIQYALESETRK